MVEVELAAVVPQEEEAKLGALFPVVLREEGAKPVAVGLWEEKGAKLVAVELRERGQWRPGGSEDEEKQHDHEEDSQQHTDRTPLAPI